MSSSHYGDAIEPIAIIGMAARFPGEATSVEKLWDMIVGSRTGHSKTPSNRFHADAWYHPNHERRGAIQPRSGFFLDEDISLFDAPFFSITAKEAAGMDPMQRQLLEVAYETFENAGIPMEKLPGSSTAVFTGVMTNDYELLSGADTFDLPQNAASGTSRAMLSNRLSWFFNLRGPSFTLDTACSSSLYALHLACQSLRLGESTQALVTGANLILHPNFNSQLSSMHMLSPDGKSHSFDKRANGYARGEAIGALIVKPLRLALEDGDTIRAVIRGSGTNQDGKTPGITMPSGEAQAALIKTTYASAGLSLQNTGYFEAHGTGTALGDPIELGAIGSSFGAVRSVDSPLYVGSIKTNVGHTEGTAGLAGVLKAVLSLEKGLIPANAGFETLNPRLLLREWKLALALETTPWPSGPRRASVNSFGFGGSNAHVIIDDAYHYLRDRNLSGSHQTSYEDEGYASRSDSGSDTDLGDGTKVRAAIDSYDSTKLFVFSSLDRAGIQRTCASYLNLMLEQAQTKKKEFTIDNLAYTLSSHRTRFDFRSFAVASSLETLTDQLRQGLPKLKRVSRHENVILIFTGQGAQWPAMGRELLLDPIFKESVLRSQSHLDSFGCTWKAIDLLSDPKDKRIDVPGFCQPLCTILQIALVDLLNHWGLRAKAVVGHSSGEISAAYAARLITQEDAVKIAYFRGVFCDDVNNRLGTKRGTMMAAGLTEAEAHEYLEVLPSRGAVVGCINSPSSVTISGDVEAIQQLEEMLKRDGKFARTLRVQVAYHSPHMQTVADDFLKSMGTIHTATSASDTIMFSSVTEELIEDPSTLNAEYWVRNMVSAVRFSGAVTRLLNHSKSPHSRRKAPIPWTAMVEVGPHEALKGPINQITAAFDTKLSESIAYTSILSRNKHAVTTAKQAVGLLWGSGHSIDLNKVNYTANSEDLKVLVELPAYAWNHEKGFWHEPSASLTGRMRAEPRTDLLGVPIDKQNPFEPSWRNILRVSECPWQEDHVITGTILYPGAGMLIMALEAALKLRNPNKILLGIEFQDVTFDKGLVIPSADHGVEVILNVRPHDAIDDMFYWTIFSIPLGGSWTKHCSGIFSILYQEQPGDIDPESEYIADWNTCLHEYEDIKARSSKEIDTTSFYQQLQAVGMEYGPTFTNLTQARAIANEQTGHGTIAIPNTKVTMPYEYEYPHLIHPATLDAIFHLIFIALTEGEPMKEAAIPLSMEKMFVAAEQPAGVGAKFTGFSRATKTGARDVAGDLVISDESWVEPKVIVRNMVVREVSGTSSVNQSGSSTSTPKRVAGLVWKEDIDSLEGSRVGEHLETKARERTGYDCPTTVSQLSCWLDLACHKNADLKVLFLIANTSARSLSLISRFAPRKERKLSFQYLCVGVPTGNLKDQLEPRIAEGDFAVDLKILNTQEEIKSFGTHDIILVEDQLTSLQSSGLSKIVQLLRPEGWLAVLETSQKATEETLSWEALMLDASLGKVVAAIKDQDSALMIAANRDEMPLNTDITEVFLLHRSDQSETAANLMLQLSRQLSSAGINVGMATLSETNKLAGKVIVSFLELDEPLVISWNEQEFEQFRGLVATAQYLLWVTRGGAMSSELSSLGFAPTTGLLRTIRVEKPQIILPHVDLSPTTDLTSGDTAALLLSVLRATIKARSDSKNNEMEFVESNGHLLIPRVMADESFDDEMGLHSSNIRSVNGLLHNDLSNLRLEVEVPEDPSSIRWIHDTQAARPPSDSEVILRTTHVALTELDFHTLPSVGTRLSLGRQAVGIVTQVGTNVVNIKPGDRVASFGPQPMRTRIRQDQSLVQRVPDKLSSRAVACLPYCFMTAYYALVDVARLKKGESIFIDAAIGTLGQALIQVANILSAEVFVAVDSMRYKQMCTEKYHVAADHILDSRSKFLYKSLSSKVGSNGINVVVATVNSQGARAQLNSVIANCGRFLDISRNIGGVQLAKDLRPHNTSISTINIDLLPTDKLSKLMEKTFDLMRLGLIGQIYNTETHSVSELHHLVPVMKAQTVDAIIVELDEDAIVPLLPSPPPALVLDDEATYVLSGGLGALGLTIAKNMVEHGARHLMFLSRSGAATIEQQTVLQQFRDKGCRIDAVSCDITNTAQVQRLASTIEDNQWKVKGVVQCAMVLRDSIFENMTYERWRTAVDPKIKGTWNLHWLLPKEVDFFIILSSMSGIIGNTAQANYCAGNTYEDAIAHHRRKMGLAATTLNVGLVTDASHFNEDSTFEDYLKKYGHWKSAQVTDKELQIALTAVMRGETADGEKIPTQLLVGVTDDIQRDGQGLNLWPKDRKFDHRVSRSTETGSKKEKTVGEILRGAQTLKDAAFAVENSLRANVATAMTATPDDIDVEKPLYSFGIDSLKAIEIRNWIFRELKCDISVFDILSPMPLSRLAVKIVGKSSFVQPYVAQAGLEALDD